MPYSYRIDKDLKIVFSKAFGVFTEDDIRGHSEDLLNDPEFDRTYNQFVDFSEVTKLEVSLALVRSKAMSRLFSETSKRAAVAPQDVVYGSVRVFEGYSSSDMVKVFRDVDEARRWLNLD